MCLMFRKCVPFVIKDIQAFGYPNERIFKILINPIIKLSISFSNLKF